MKTANMIQMLKCTSSKQECKYCFAKKDCDKICKDPMVWPKELANRMEQLLIHLRSTKEQNGKLSSDVAYWKHRYETLLKELNKIVHQQEILNKMSSQGE